MSKAEYKQEQKDMNNQRSDLVYNSEFVVQEPDGSDSDVSEFDEPNSNRSKHLIKKKQKSGKKGGATLTLIQKPS